MKKLKKSGGPLNADLKSLITNKKQCSQPGGTLSPYPSLGTFDSDGDIFGYHTWRRGMLLVSSG